jgi:NAD-dependent dihydropyrimidine dehydrogenase PreA subunit
MSKNWFPIIDYEKCSGCLTCFNFCQHGVFIVEKGKPKVVKPENCVEFCRGCSKICPQKAIRYVKRYPKENKKEKNGKEK